MVSGSGDGAVTGISKARDAQIVSAGVGKGELKVRVERAVFGCRTGVKAVIVKVQFSTGSIKHADGGWEHFERDNAPDVVEEFIAQNLPMGKWGWPEPVGDMVAFLSSDRAGLITGACIAVDGGQGNSLI